MSDKYTWLDQVQDDFRNLLKELSWKSIKRLATDPVETRVYSSVYLMFSGLLFLSTVWAFLDEFAGYFPRRQWKEYQNYYKEAGIETAKNQVQKLVEKEGADFKNKIQKLEEEKVLLTSKLLEGEEYKKLNDEYFKYAEDLRVASVHLADLKAADNEAYYFYVDALKKNEFRKAATLKAKIDTLRGLMEESNKRVEDFRTKRDAVKDKKSIFENKVDAVQMQIDSLNGQVVLYQTAIENYKKRRVQKIEQVVLRSFELNIWREYVMEVDRCQSCHMAWKDPIFKDYEGEYKTISYAEFAGMHWKFHALETAGEFSKLNKEEKKKVIEEITHEYERWVKADSTSLDKLQIRVDPFQYHSEEIMKVHNIEKMGCVSCHYGQGLSTDVGQAHARHGEPGFDHYWEKPLLEGKFIESSCEGCHGTAINLQMAPTVSLGKKLVLDLGCWGCHTIPNQDKYPLRKVGPDLNGVMKKDYPEFVFEWLKHPKDFYPHTRMPNFYLTDDEALKITAYLNDLSKSSNYVPQEKYPGKGDAENGKKLVVDIGCTACHSAGDVQWTNFTDTPALREGAGYAPSLDKIASKTNGNADWMYDWIRNPKRYNPNTRMPNLRLSEKEAADITAYLLTLKDPNFNPPKADENKLNDKAYVEEGKKLIATLGCYGCHDLKEHNALGNVGVALSEIGSKNEHELDFGEVISRDKYHFNHSWEGWIKGKIREPRQYATDRIVSLMPNYGLNETEVEAITVALKGWRKEKIADVYQAKKSLITDNYDRGQFFVRDNNCIGCHQIEEYPGGYRALQLEDKRFAPPPLTYEGAKVQEQWLIKFLNDPGANKLRPHPNMTTRMPTFGYDDDEWNIVMKYFLSIGKEDLKMKAYPAPETTPEKLAMGEKLFEKFQCQRCHITGTERSAEDLEFKIAPNFMFTPMRLKPDWVHAFIGWPAFYQPGTQMPGFFGEGYQLTPFPDSTIGKNPKEQAKYQGSAMRDYLYYRVMGKGKKLP